MKGGYFQPSKKKKLSLTWVNCATSFKNLFGFMLLLIV